MGPDAEKLGKQKVMLDRLGFIRLAQSETISEPRLAIELEPKT